MCCVLSLIHTGYVICVVCALLVVVVFVLARVRICFRLVFFLVCVVVCVLDSFPTGRFSGLSVFDLVVSDFGCV